MTAIRRPRLGVWGDRGLSKHGYHVIIFVHGILSDSRTFDRLLSYLVAADPTHDFDFWIFDYDYNQRLVESGDQLARAISTGPFQNCRVDIVGHSMGGLVARMAVLRNKLPTVARIVTLATPNHGTINGSQLNLLGQMTTLGLRRLHPIYARAPGIIDLTNVPDIMKDELRSMGQRDRTRIDNKSYVSIPAQYFNRTRQLGQAPPSTKMGGVMIIRMLVNFVMPFRILLTPVHDGIVEERSNQLHPALTGSSNEGAYMRTRSAPAKRILHITHEAAADCDHITVMACPEIAELIFAVLRAAKLEARSIDPFLSESRNRVTLRPKVT